jgi:hypothetical protein
MEEFDSPLSAFAFSFLSFPAEDDDDDMESVVVMGKLGVNVALRCCQGLQSTKTELPAYYRRDSFLDALSPLVSEINSG